jgi:hypothetical protein
MHLCQIHKHLQCQVTKLQLTGKWAQSNTRDVRSPFMHVQMCHRLQNVSNKMCQQFAKISGVRVPLRQPIAKESIQTVNRSFATKLFKSHITEVVVVTGPNRESPWKNETIEGFTASSYSANKEEYGSQTAPTLVISILRHERNSSAVGLQ